MSLKKRGISAIVAVVLMILITIAGVVLVYQGIFPMLKNLDLHTSKNSISIVTSGGYTLYDDEQKIACVQVKRETLDPISGLKVLFSVESNSHSAIISEEDVPELNQKRTYCFNLSSFGRPDTVTVVTLPEGKSIAVTSIVPVKKLVSLVVSSWGDSESGDSVRYLDDEWIFLTRCAALNRAGAKYKLATDISIEDSNLIPTGSSIASADFCLVVTRDDIVLDLGGHSLKGGVVGGGIYLGGASGVKVMNGKLESLSYGLILEEVNKSVISNLAVTETDYNGVFLRHSYNNSLKDIKVNTTYGDNADGIEINESDFNQLEGIHVLDSGDEGIEVEGGSNNSIRDVVIINAGGNGIKISGAVGPDQGSNFFDGVEITNSANNGIEMYMSHFNNFLNLSLISSGGDGVRAFSSRRNNFHTLVVRGSVDESVDLDTYASYNIFDSFYFTDKKVKVYSSSYNQFINGIINGSSSQCDTSYCSVYLYYGSRNSFRNVTFFDNRDTSTYSFYFRKKESANNYFSNLTLCGYSARYRCPDNNIIYQYYGPSNSYYICTSTVGWNLAVTGTCP